MGYIIEAGKLTLTNGSFVRTMELPTVRGKYLLKEYRPMEGEFLFFEPESDEFAFELGDVLYTGATGWKLLDIVELQNLDAGEGITVSLEALDQKVKVCLTYVWYGQLPFVCKNLTIQNCTNTELCLESVDVEKFAITGFWAPTYSWILSDYGRKKSIGPYLGNLQDSLILVHHPDWEAGIVLGNEAPGVLKGASVWSRSREITLGLTHKDEDFPFRKHLAGGEVFVASDVFTGVYNHQKDTHIVMNQMVQDYVRKYMGIRLTQIEERPVFVYNTWQPFEYNI